MLKAIALASAFTSFGLPALSFEISFDWAGLKLCTSGNPNTVANPRFVLSDVPDGTKFIKFKLVDRNVPGYNHGGGTIAYAGQDVIEPGAFNYKSPCPPGGSHTYEWTATAQSKKSGGKLEVAKAERRYPE
jgi:phosphatidylethanolamine-binding protein (PEBP) family uncharacterized protein